MKTQRVRVYVKLNITSEWHVTKETDINDPFFDIKSKQSENGETFRDLLLSKGSINWKVGNFNYKAILL